MNFIELDDTQIQSLHFLCKLKEHEIREGKATSWPHTEVLKEFHQRCEPAPEASLEIAYIMAQYPMLAAAAMAHMVEHELTTNII